MLNTYHLGNHHFFLIWKLTVLELLENVQSEQEMEEEGFLTSGYLLLCLSLTLV